MTAADGFSTWLEESRAASGVPRRVEDSGVLVEVARRLVAAEPREGGERRAAKSA